MHARIEDAREDPKITKDAKAPEGRRKNSRVAGNSNKVKYKSGDKTDKTERKMTGEIKKLLRDRISS